MCKCEILFFGEKKVSQGRPAFYKLHFSVSPFVGLNYEPQVFFSFFFSLMQYFVCRWVVVAQIQQHLGLSATMVFTLVSMVWQYYLTSGTSYIIPDISSITEWII